MEIELQLTLVLRHERTQRGLQRDVTVEFRGELPDRGEVGEAVEPFFRRLPGGMNQAPLLQVPQMILADPGIETAHVARTVQLPSQRVIVGGRRHPRVKMRHAHGKVN